MADSHVVGLDIAKSVFQLRGLDTDGATVIQKRLTRVGLFPFFRSCRHVWLGSRLALRRISGARELTKQDPRLTHA